MKPSSMAVVPHPRRLLGKQDLRAGAMRVVVVVAVVGGTEVAALVLNSATTVGQVLQCTVGVARRMARAAGCWSSRQRLRVCPPA